MKRWLAISLAILITIAMTLPALAAPVAIDDQPNKMHVEIQTGSYRLANGVVYGGYIRCTTIEGGSYTIIMGYAGGADEFDTWGFTCLGEVTVNDWHGHGPNGYYGYYQDATASIHVTYSTNSNGQPDAPGTIYYDADAQTTGNWELAHNNLGPGTVGIGEATGEVWHGGEAFIEDQSLTNYIYAHDTVKPPCSQNLESINTVGSGTIDAKNESGVAETLVVNTEYRLTVSGGPWNDGSADRYDTAVKIGEEDWTPLEDWSGSIQTECSEGDPLDPTKTIIIFRAIDTAWKIRVDDMAGQFSDNSGGMDYLLEEVQPTTPYSCENQYLLGTQLGRGTIDAKSSTGNQIFSASGGLSPGSWIAIVTSAGPWLDGGSGIDRYDIAMKNVNNTWTELKDYSGTACHTQNGNYITAYVQILQAGDNRLRVNDTGGVWSNNTGSMDFTIYSLTYSPFPPGGCSQTYQLGDLVSTLTVSGSSMQGLSMHFGKESLDATGGETELPKRYYAVETSGIWYNGSLPSAIGGIVEDPNTSASPNAWGWTDLQNFPDVVCSAPLDPIGHIIIYFTNIKDAAYWFRAQDVGGNYSDNSGSLTFTIYKAINLRIPPYTPGSMPPSGICDPYYSHEATGVTSILLGNNEIGNALPALTSNKIYAIETAAGPWKNNGTESYEVAISEDNGTSWHVLSDYPSALCAQSDDGDHILVYFLALAGRNYKLRVYDPGEAYADNTHSINYILYDQIVFIHNPWHTCSDDYKLTQVTIPEEDSQIIANWAAGKAITSIVTGKTYAIEISDTRYWNYLISPNQHRYDAQISADNGSNWEVIDQDISNLADCIVQTNTASIDYEKTYRIYFTATGNYKLRVNSGLISPNWVGMNGYLVYYLYSAETTNPTNPSCTPTKDDPCTNPIPPPWQSACYETYLRPSSLFKIVNFQIPSIDFGSLGLIDFPAIGVPVPAVDDWLSYLGWSIRNYFAWCPMHTAALAAIPITLNDYEPFGTINELHTSITHINDLLNGLIVSKGGENESFTPYSVIFNSGGGEEGATNWQGILPVISSDSPWMGGQLQWNGGNGVHIDTTGASGGELQDMTSNAVAYVNYCRSIFDAHMGNGLSFGLCSIVSMARTAPIIWILLQLCMDVGAVWAIVKYIQKKWIDLAGSR